MEVLDDDTWAAAWAWGIPLVAINVMVHVFFLGLISERIDHFHARLTARRHFESKFAIIMGVAATMATALHGIEAGIWAAAYELLGVMPNNRAAMLFSLGAMTTYGDGGVALPARWRMMGALEALNGVLLFGLTTAFLFAMIQRVQSTRGRRGG